MISSIGTSKTLETCFSDEEKFLYKYLDKMIFESLSKFANSFCGNKFCEML